MLLPAKVMDGVVKVAMEKALLHTRRTKTAEAERRRRSLLSSRAEFRHTRSGQPSKEVRILHTSDMLSVELLFGFLGGLLRSKHVRTIGY